jgi:Cellulase (glycosyl hydrolase family 5)
MVVSNVLGAAGQPDLPRRPHSSLMTVRRLVPLFACAIALLASAAPANAFQIGMQDDDAFVSAPPAARARALDQAHAMGVTYIRITMVWEGFRNDGLGPYDAAINEARRRGMSVQLTVTGNPSFTAGGRGYLGYRHPSPARFGRWIGQLARHFKGRVRWYSAWNEPNLEEYLAPQMVRGRRYGHVLYAKLVRAAYRAVKRADPQAKLLVGEAAPSGHPVRFIERAARALPGGLKADGWAHHPYQFVKVVPGRPQRRYSGGISNIGQMKATMRRLARQRKLRTAAGRPLPLFFTEFGYPRPGAFYGFFSEALRTSYTLAAFRLAKRYGAAVLVWYQLYNHPGRPRSGVWDTGLIGADGTPSGLYKRLVASRVSLAGF